MLYDCYVIGNHLDTHKRMGVATGRTEQGNCKKSNKYLSRINVEGTTDYDICTFPLSQSITIQKTLNIYSDVFALIVKLTRFYFHFRPTDVTQRSQNRRNTPNFSWVRAMRGCVVSWYNSLYPGPVTPVCCQTLRRLFSFM